MYHGELTLLFLYQTTSLPPSTMAGALAAVSYQRQHMGDRQGQQLNVAAVKAELSEIDLPVMPNPSHIIPLVSSILLHTCKI